MPSRRQTKTPTKAPVQTQTQASTRFAIRGSRSMLRGDDWFPYRGAASITFSTPIAPAGHEWRDVVLLRDEVRGEILKYCGEPDLAR